MRLSCCVPMCRRTRARKYPFTVVDGVVVGSSEEWLCQKHWSALPKPMRKRHIDGKRAVRLTREEAAYEASMKIWEECKTRAIETAFGLA